MFGRWLGRLSIYEEVTVCQRAIKDLDKGTFGQTETKEILALWGIEALDKKEEELEYAVKKKRRDLLKKDLMEILWQEEVSWT